MSLQLFFLNNNSNFLHYHCPPDRVLFIGILNSHREVRDPVRAKRLRYLLRATESTSDEAWI